LTFEGWVVAFGTVIGQDCLSQPINDHVDQSSIEKRTANSDDIICNSATK